MTLTFVLVVNFLIMGSMRIVIGFTARGQPGARAVILNGVFSGCWR